ncbi:NUDIX hydrolase [Marinilongibacter aquaticus]|uniref:NUDIX domain-containing protein n=1 Tax=Marinilongibacter aquaticus TaxID=2975157 RepID=UPI0021BD9DAF|nr:NUDIX hydrolase [Marinilongibacter aquaticus]UBM59684.1 NUDIX hydrolase [Marinilongibacter aquaticus]
MIAEKNPWTVKSEEVVYANNWIEVVHKEVLNPNGNPGIYGQVNFKNLAIGIIPIDDEGYTWLVGQYRFPIEEYSWEIPEGGCPEGESPEDTAKRELKEETGLRAEKLELLSKIHTSNSVCREVGYVYLAEGLSQELAEPEDTEQLTVKKVHLKEALEMVLNNEITDSLSVAGILKVARLKGY